MTTTATISKTTDGGEDVMPYVVLTGEGSTSDTTPCQTWEEVKTLLDTYFS